MFALAAGLMRAKALEPNGLCWSTGPAVPGQCDLERFIQPLLSSAPVLCITNSDAHTFPLDRCEDYR